MSGSLFSKVAFLKHLSKIPSKMRLVRRIQYFSRRAEIEMASNSLTIKHQIDEFFVKNLNVADREIYQALTFGSRSQCRQDLIIAMLSDWLREGQVIEVGATDGIFLSNSFLLEDEFGWSSVLIEPSRNWHKELFNNRPNADIFIEAVSSESGHEVGFTQTEFAELSGITHSLPSDNWARERQHSIQYEVETITLDEICKDRISANGFLAVSIDIEGGELEAIRGFANLLNLASVILVENNGSPEKIISLDSSIFAHGNFIRVNWPFESFDSWYVSRNLVSTNKVLQQSFNEVEFIHGEQKSGL